MPDSRKTASASTSTSTESVRKRLRGSLKVRAVRISGARVKVALEQLSHEQWPDAGLPMYVHVPFCPNRCGGCTKPIETDGTAAAVDDYLRRLEVELSLITGALGTGRRISQLHIGGGTPNFLSDAHLARVVEMINARFVIDEAAESTIEVSPGRSARRQMQLLAGLGFNNLRFEYRGTPQPTMGSNLHLASPELLMDTVEGAREAGFRTVTADLLYGAPGISRETTLEYLSTLVDLGIDRIVCSVRDPLSFSDPGHRQPSRPAVELSPAWRLATFTAMVEECEKAGYDWVGVSAFARRGDPWCEAQDNGSLSRNWSGYSTVHSPWLIGVGLGAVSELPGLVSQNHLGMADWSDDLDHGRLPAAFGVALSRTDEQERALIAVLAANLKANEPAFAEHEGMELLGEMKDKGLIEADGDSVQVTTDGRALLNQILERDCSHTLLVS